MKKIKIYNTTTQEWQDISAGQTGPRGAQGEAGPKGDSFTYEDFTAEQLESLKGPKGDTGAAGAAGSDGITPIVTITNITGGHNIDFNYGTGDARNTNVNIYDGAQGNPGTNGTNGTDGHTPVITATKSNGVTTVYSDGVAVATINDGSDGAPGTPGTNGTNGVDGANGADGDDGITPIVTVTSITGGHNVAFDYGTDDSRNTNFDVMDGEDASGGGGLPSIIAGTGTAGEIFNYDASGNSGTNRAIGSYSHAEGYQTVAGSSAHAEGDNSYAGGYASHAEGSYTVTYTAYQHAQGKYNIRDNEGTYAHIVGNGTSNNERSNAHTLDWSGNAWYAGSVSAGTTATPAAVVNDNDLTTKAYVDNAISQSGGGGGSYTAGTGIDITNGVISLALEQAEGVEI